MEADMDAGMVAGTVADEWEAVASAEFIPWEELRGATLLVTGSTGLVGRTLTGGLLRANRRRKLKLALLALVRDEARARERFADLPGAGGALRLLRGSVEELPAVEGPVDYVVHAAGETASLAFVQKPVETLRAAALGAMNLLELAREKRSRGFVYLSSMEVYGQPPGEGKLRESAPCALRPLELRACYPIGKLLGESLCRAYAAECGVPASIVRLAQVCGPGCRPEDERLFAQLERCIREGRPFAMRTRGEAAHSYLRAADAATAALTALLRGEPGRAYNAADEESFCSVAEMAARVARSGGIALRFEPDGAGSCGYPAPARLELDASLLRSLGWAPARDAGRACEG